jgi:hypothetical protein
LVNWQATRSTIDQTRAAARVAGYQLEARRQAGLEENVLQHAVVRQKYKSLTVFVQSPDRINTAIE